MAMQIPTKGKKRDIGEATWEAIHLAFDQDGRFPRIVNTAVDRYLKGHRNFKVEDPFDRGRTSVEIQLDDGYPAHEAVVSEVNAEIGKQERIDISPVTRMDLQTIKSARDAAVGQGLLSYHFSDRVTRLANQAFSRGRVIEGCAGLAITPTRYPGFGWGLKVINIRSSQLVFLPVGGPCVDAIVWRQWLPFDSVNDELRRLSVITGGKIQPLPAKGTEEYRLLQVQEVPYGSTIDAKDEAMGPGGGLFTTKASREISGGKAKKKFGRFVPFIQVFFSEDKVLLDRRLVMTGKFVNYDQQPSETERPQMPIGVGHYAVVGGPYGRSYAHARMAVNIRNERILTKLLRNFSDTDAYGIVAISSGMGVDLSDLFKQGDGFKALTYTTDANETKSAPTQLAPIQMDKIVGRVFGIMQVLDDDVFPDSPLNQGRSIGRIDSDKAIARVDALGQTSMRAGSESARAVWVQMFRAGLEMAADHHSDGDKIPIFHLVPQLAGVILDVEQIPESLEEKERKSLKRQLRLLRSGEEGRIPLIEEEMNTEDSQGVLAAPGSGRADLVPIPRFSIGPNIIPSPNEINIDIRSVMPRDDDREYNDIVTAVKLGASSIMEAQIEMRIRGINTFFGGHMVWATYKTAVLNLLSAFGDGVEAGPILIQPHLFSRLVGYWVVSSFVAEPLFGLASKVVRQQVLRVLQHYVPVNQVGGQMSADEAAAVFGQQQQQRQLQERGQQLQLPQEGAA